MPLPIPNVSPYPGVPPLPGGGVPIVAEALAVASVALGVNLPQQWGIFDSATGAPILTADSVNGFEYARDYRISDYPQQDGSFQSYNKVFVPYQAKVRFAVADSLENRAQFLAALDPAIASLDLVTVVTPEISYASANLTHADYRREAGRGYRLLIVDVWCEEVRPTGTAQYSQQGTQAINPAPTASGTLSNTQSPSGTSPVQLGNVQVQNAAATVVGDDDPNSPTSAVVSAAQGAGEGGYGNVPTPPPSPNNAAAPLSFSIAPQPK